MTNSELEKLLKSVPQPGRPAAYWEEFPGRVQSNLRQSPEASATRSANSKPSSPDFSLFRFLPRLAWVSAVAILCLSVGFGIGHWHKTTQVPDFALLQNETTVRGILTMFPNRVIAIIQTEQGLQLVLSDNPDVPTSPPLWIKVGEGKQGQAAVTFSGQEIQIGGEKMTVLSDAQGGVILMAKQLIWSSTAPSQTPNKLKIQAKSLGTVSM